MRLRLLGADSRDGDSPTLYDTDEDQYVIQGYVLDDPAALAQIGGVPAGETVIRVPKRLMRYLPEGEHGKADVRGA